MHHKTGQHITERSRTAQKPACGAQLTHLDIRFHRKSDGPRYVCQYFTRMPFSLRPPARLPVAPGIAILHDSTRPATDWHAVSQRVRCQGIHVHRTAPELLNQAKKKTVSAGDGQCLDPSIVQALPCFIANW